MRLLFCSLLLVLISTRSYTQQSNDEVDWSVFGQIFNEVDLSANFSVYSDCKNNFGGGVAVRHIFFNDLWINLGIGIEYSFTQYKRKYALEVLGTYYSEPDVAFHNITIPGIVRFCVGGEKLKALFEVGLYAEVSMPRITVDYATTNINGQTIVESGKYKLSPAFNGGPQAAIGMKIPVGRHDIILKGQYRFGIRRNLAQSELYQNFTNDYVSFNVGFNWAK